MLLGKTVISLVVNLYCTGNNGSAQKLVEEMESSGIADAIRKEEENEHLTVFTTVIDYRYTAPF